MLQISTDEAWLWIAVEPIHKQILGVYIPRHRKNMIVAESFLRSLIKIYGKHIVSSDGGTWYPEACIPLGLEHRCIHHMKSIVERTIEYLKDRTEVFDEYYPCRKAGLCDLLHFNKWLTLFVFMHNSIVKSSSKFHNMMR